MSKSTYLLLFSYFIAQYSWGTVSIHCKTKISDNKEIELIWNVNDIGSLRSDVTALTKGFVSQQETANFVFLKKDVVGYYVEEGTIDTEIKIKSVVWNEQSKIPNVHLELHADKGHKCASNSNKPEDLDATCYSLNYVLLAKQELDENGVLKYGIDASYSNKKLVCTHD